ncbi:endonuclease III domain-containing protein [Lacticaseibacillus mingshuiensis]|uniref:endonuclease III domain-containing protein n=1 Tax=Lacticaseibacillus mingshuiensis TaxID=2799574 RepID=UPI0019415529|nr:deoxyribonuclease I [Lacticaseibacillus mingshuiensis]
MPLAELTLPALYHKLAQQGPSGWWPADSKYEILVGAILVQNTNWTNVAKSLANLRASTEFDPAKLAAMSQEALIEQIRPSGFYQNKSRALLALFAWLKRRDFDLPAIAQTPLDQLRPQLLALPGIGQETADAMLLFVFDQSVFVADTYARRLFTWLGQPTATYSALKAKTHEVDAWPLHDAQELHGLIDNFGKTVKDPATFAASSLAGMTLVL